MYIQISPASLVLHVHHVSALIVRHVYIILQLRLEVQVCKRVLSSEVPIIDSQTITGFNKTCNDNENQRHTDGWRVTFALIVIRSVAGLDSWSIYGVAIS